MNEEIKNIAVTTIELASLVEKLASENEVLEAAAVQKPAFDAAKLAAAIDKCASAGIISPKEKDQIAARVAQDPDLALILVEKAASALADRVSPMGSAVEYASRTQAKDAYDEAFGVA